MKKILLVFSLLAFVIMGVNAQTPWYLTGNSGTNPSSNFIGTTDNNPLIFKTAGNERMKLLSDKPFLGIGVSTPQATLHLHYQDDFLPPSLKLLQLTTPTSPDGFSIFSDKNTKDILFKQNEEAKFFVEGPGGGFVIAPTGNLGIGTATPTEKLHINGNILSEGNLTVKDKITLTPDYEAEDSFWEIERNSNGLSFVYTIPYIISDSSAVTPDDIERGNPSVSYSRMFINNTGDIGIGTTNPTAKLDVVGSVQAQNANITNTLTATALVVETATIESMDVLNANSATITNTLTANTLSAQNATINNTLAAYALNAEKADIMGKIKAMEIQVTFTDWPDVVFSKDYKLPTLKEVKQFITENQHLPNVPSEAEVKENGVNLGEMNATLLQKIEELTLYILDLQQQIDELKTK